MSTSVKVAIAVLLSFIGIFTADSIGNNFEEQGLHASAKIQKKFGWNLHMSARNFYTEEDRKILRDSKKTIQRAYISLPSDHRNSLKKLEIRNQNHISRGMANEKKLIINTGRIQSAEELKSVFIHEMGHVYDLGGLVGHKSSGRSPFVDGKKPIYNDDPSLDFYRISWDSAKRKKASARNGDFVSGYAKTDIFEDFAESYIFYRLHGEKFRAMMRDSKPLEEKYQFLKTQVFSDQEFQIQKNERAPSKNIWDATLL